MTVAIAPALHIPNIGITPVRRETRHGDDANYPADKPVW
jgi:hypothetical protein